MTLVAKAFVAIMVSAVIGGGVLRDRGKPSLEQPPVLSGSTMGTYFRVALATQPVTLSKDALQSAIEADLEEINSSMSTYLPDSEVSRFNDHRGTDWFPVSKETVTVVMEALHVFRRSEGAFEITVGPLVNLWGFGSDQKVSDPPSTESIENALENIGSKYVHARISPPALRKERELLEIDLSGIAKGFAVDSLAESLETMGIKDYLVDIGGEMVAQGLKADGSSWNIGIENPTINQRSVHRTIPLTDRAIATSGDYRNYFESNGRRYSHEIDPRTGQPIQHELASVTVLDPSCMRADAWATALIVLGPKIGLQVAEREGLAAYFIIKDDGGFLQKESKGFSRESTKLQQ